MTDVMGGHPTTAARRPGRWVLLAAPLVMVACSSDDGGTAERGPVSVSAATEATTSAPPVTSELGTRPVPTLPPPTIAGQVDADDGVVDASPTIAPAPEPPADPDEPATTAAPPTTELVGDPQPQPNDTTPAPPPPEDPGPDACTRLADFDVVGVISGAIGANTAAETVSDSACRYSDGGFVTEVHFVPIGEIRDDWYLRLGIEAVGEVGGDAVGFSSYVPPGAAGGDGYTIAVEGGGQGAIVAVTGTSDARLVAGQVALMAQQAA